MSTQVESGHLAAPADVRLDRPRARLGRTLAAAGAVVLVGVALSMAIGSESLALGTVVDQVLDGPGDDSDARVHRIVWELRAPRTLIALAVGAALGVAGAVMQTLTRNPLADPGILGVNAGAALAVSVGLVLGLAGTVDQLVWWAMAGAAVATVAVYALGSVGGGTTPVRLALAGTAVSAVMVGITTSLSVSFPASFDVFRFWSVGAFEGRGWDVVVGTVPFLAVGALVALVVAPGLDLLATGEDNARALGVRVGVTRAGAAVATTLLCGAAVAAAGPIGFVGLTVPHVVRGFTGPDARRLLPACALAGAALLVLADVVGRLVARPGEVEAGIITALIGGPVFIALVRRRGAVAL